ncbi:MAG: ABC transporter ATP-binding protein [Thermoplasmata archaeon]|nr:MAG: ABC transporter ATP-binding protein [Thermoplasmata archaeon]
MYNSGSVESFCPNANQPIGKNSLVILNNLSKSFKKFKVLNNISFSINQGDVIGFIGPNGAGKTTTIKILVGLLRDFDGQVMINGYSIPTNIGNVYHMIGYLPQKVSFQRWRTVDHALSTFGKLSGLDKRILERRIVKVLKLVDLLDVRHKKIVHLSGGMVQRLGLAQAILHNPKLIILDEPLAGLDPENRYKIKKIIRDLSKNGTTVLFSSHILSDVQDTVSKIIIINNGKVMHFGTIDSLRDNFISTKDIEIELCQAITYWNGLERIDGVNCVEQTQPNRILIHLQNETDINEVSKKLQRYFFEYGYVIRTFTPVVKNLEELYILCTRGGESK